MLKMSIITAVYNRHDTIGRAIQSVRDQSYPQIEHVIVDGGSTDGTLLELEKDRYAGLTIVSEPDEGIYDALNKGLALVSGDVIGFVHSDDVLVNDKVIASVMDVFSREDVDIVYGDAVFFEKGKFGSNIRKYVSGEFSARRLAWGWMPAHPAMFIKKQVYEKYGNFRTDYKIAADYEFLCRIAVDGLIRSHYLPDTLVKMQVGGASSRGFKSTVVVTREALRGCLSNNINTNIFMILSRYPKKLMQRFLR